MKKLLIISTDQFGYHTDIFKWCEYLRDEYEIETVTFKGRPKVELDDVKNHYVSNSGRIQIRGLRYILTCLWHILFFKGAILVCHFKGCYILKKCFPWKKMILDIRTLGVSKDNNLRKRADAVIKNNAEKFDYVTIISEGLRKKLSLPEEKSAILPLGADAVSKTTKSFEKLRLLYIGTLSNRDIHKTIEGVLIAMNQEKNLDIHYDIIGDGLGNELEELKQLVKGKGLDNNITLHGYIQHEKLQTYLDNCNIGVSFIPMTEYYEHQPATKTFEYILSGLFTLATATYSNREIITKENGILMEDTPESFAKAILEIYSRKDTIDGKVISSTLQEYKWKNLVNNQMKPIFRKLLQKV